MPGALEDSALKPGTLEGSALMPGAFKGSALLPGALGGSALMRSLKHLQHWPRCRATAKLIPVCNNMMPAPECSPLAKLVIVDAVSGCSL